MKILFLGGTRFMGRHAVRALIARGHDVTIATRGRAADDFGASVKRAVFNRQSAESIRSLPRADWDVVIDSLAYASNDARVLLDNISCKRYVYTSSCAVYERKPDIVESDFDPLAGGLIWCAREDFPYDEIKRQTERAVFGHYSALNAAAARFPYAVGEDDYTNRLFFYVGHVMREKPMHIDNLNARLAFVRSDEAGKFLAFLAESGCRGAFNGASAGAISVGEIAEYVIKNAGGRLVLSESAEPAPYNGDCDHSVNADKARALGFEFTALREWIFALLDAYIARARAV